jgi:hypothetical protein
MTGSGGTTVVGGSGSGSGGSGGGSADYTAEAGHAQTADTATEATNLASDSTDWNKILRKDVADTAAEIITFAKGIISTLVSKFKAGILIGANDQYGINSSGNATLNNVNCAEVHATSDSSIGGDMRINGNATIDSDLNVGADVTASGSITAGDDLHVDRNAYVTGNMTAAQLIASMLKTPDFAQVAGMIGLGFGVTTDQNGRATLQTDDLVVLGKMIVNALNVREVTYIGGTYLLTPAGSTIAKVMRLYAAQTSQIQYSRYWTTTTSNYAVGYRVMWKADDGTTGTMNYWKVGDQAFCQTFNLTASGQYTTAENRRYWRLVCRVGQVTVDGETFHYADLADIDTVYLYGIPHLFEGRENRSGSVPAEGDKVVCLGSQTDTTRQGAIQLTAEGEASIGIYDGIDLFTSLSNYEIHYFSKSAVRMNAAYITWKTTGGNETQANFMATTKQAFIGIGNCGIDFTNGAITAKGGKFQMEDENGNPTFELDTDGNLNSKGNASFGGTIKAKNFFHNICHFTEGNAVSPNTYSHSRYYCTTTHTEGSTEYVAGEYYENPGSQYFLECTYDADVIDMIPITTDWSGSKKTVNLPDPKDFYGKQVRVSVLKYGSGTQNAIVGCVVFDRFAQDVKYENGKVLRVLSGQLPTITIAAGTSSLFESIEADDGYGNTTYYWLQLQS